MDRKKVGTKTAIEAHAYTLTIEPRRLAESVSRREVTHLEPIRLVGETANKTADLQTEAILEASGRSRQLLSTAQSPRSEIEKQTCRLPQVLFTACIASI